MGGEGGGRVVELRGFGIEERIRKGVFEVRKLWRACLKQVSICSGSEEGNVLIVLENNLMEL